MHTTATDGIPHSLAFLSELSSCGAHVAEGPQSMQGVCGSSSSSGGMNAESSHILAVSSSSTSINSLVQQQQQQQQQSMHAQAHAQAQQAQPLCGHPQQQAEHGGYHQQQHHHHQQLQQQQSSDVYHQQQLQDVPAWDVREWTDLFNPGTLQRTGAAMGGRMRLWLRRLVEDMQDDTR